MMRAALALARRSLGRTWPNPAVGCVIVKDGVIVGRGRTQDGGRPHAEVDALKKDVPKAEVHLLDAGHFALDESASDIARLTRAFLAQPAKR